MALKLISFATCPYVQRAVAVLEEKNVAHEVTYIDLAAKPEWFLKLSPRGKVPVLVADDVPMFESHAICEYLEETHPEPRLLPKDAVLRARDRAWFAYASEDLFAPSYRLAVATDAAAFASAVEALDKTLDRLEVELRGRSYLSGDGGAFGMADVAMAPFLYRAARWKARGWIDLLQTRSALAAWCDRVVSRPAIQRSVPATWEQLDLAMHQRTNSWLSRQSMRHTS
jgi:glutathione S-transferase